MQAANSQQQELLIKPVDLPTNTKIKLKSWKGDYLHRPDSEQGVTSWDTGVGNEWIVESIGDNKIKLKSWKGDYLHRPDSEQGVTSWHTGVGNEWMLEVISSEPETETTNIEAEENTATAAGDVSITQILHKGTVKGSQADEYIEITNKGAGAADLSGCRVTSAGSKKQVFTFPQGTLLQPGKSFRVYSNQVHPEFGGFSFASKTAIWKDSGDEGKLFDVQGNNVSTWAYGTSSIAGIKAELGVPQLVIQASPSAINKQTALGGKLTFTEALRLAIRSFLENDRDIESPLGLILNNPGSYDLPDDADKAAAIAVVRSYLNRPNSKIILHTAKVGYPPENGETIEANWIFELQPDKLSSSLHWAIVDRTGVKAAYNYGFG